MRAVPLDNFCEIVQGGRHKLSGRHFVDSGYPAYGAGGFNGYLPQAEFDRDAVILSAIGARCGKCFLAEGRWSSLANTQLIFPDPKTADVRYIYHQLNDEERWLRRGAAQPFIRPSDVKAHLVYLPLLGEQRRIAAILDKADALRRKRTRALELFDGLIQATLRNVMETELSLNELIEVRSLGSITNEIYRYPTYFGIDYQEFGVPEVRGELIREDGTIRADTAELRFISEATSLRFPKTRLSAGDLVMSVRGTIGKVGLVPVELDGANITANLIRIAPDRRQIMPMYLQTVLKSAETRRAMEGVTMTTTIATIKASDLRNLPIILPPMVVQRKFCALAERIYEQKVRALRQKLSIDNLFASLQHRAFTGQL